jgi:hypothetical protein
VVKTSVLGNELRILAIELGLGIMARLHTRPGHFTKVVDGICRHDALKAALYVAGLAIVLAMAIIVGIIISDAISFLFNLFSS